MLCNHFLGQVSLISALIMGLLQLESAMATSTPCAMLVRSSQCQGLPARQPTGFFQHALHIRHGGGRGRVARRDLTTGDAMRYGTVESALNGQLHALATMQNVGRGTFREAQCVDSV